jgi:hypothetical protein
MYTITIHAFSTNDIHSSKDEEIRDLKRQIYDLEQRNAKCEVMLKERDVQLAFMLHRY